MHASVVPSEHFVAPPVVQEANAQLAAVLLGQWRRHAPLQVTFLHGKVVQSKLHVLKASQVAAQGPELQVNAQVLPPLQWQVPPGQSPLQ